MVLNVTDHLQNPLDNYIASLPKVKLIRAQRREGLVRARLLGAAAATGEVLVFLDSHCEAAQGELIMGELRSRFCSET